MGVEVCNMKNDKSIYTLIVPCNGEEHQISLTKEGKLKILNHTDDEIETELALEKLGGELPECLKIQKAWNNNSYYLEQRDDDPVLGKIITYLDIANASRGLFKKKMLGLIEIFIASFVISVVISLIQQRFDLFWIYMCASTNVVFGFYYVYLLLDISDEAIYLLPFIVAVETLFYLESLHDFKILNIILFLIFMFLYIVPIVLNKVFLKVTSKIEED